jgi:putative copper export protein
MLSTVSAAFSGRTTVTTRVLLASLSEPLLQFLYPPENVDLELASAIAGLPLAWWLRPVGLGLVTLLGIVLVVPFRGQVPRSMAWGGAALSLLALAGLPLTSHAAGRDTWQVAATLSNLIHQVSVALWTGGLMLLAIWWPYRHTAAHGALSPLRRFSAIALPLVAIALVTGMINTGFTVPVVAGVEEYGVTSKAFATLWNSNYGVLLFTKLLILLIPLGLAIRHRATIARGLGTATRGVGARLGRSIRLESLAVAGVVLAGVGLSLSVPPVLDRPPLDTVILAAPAYTAEGAMADVVHLALDPAEPSENRLQLPITDPYGEPISTDPRPVVTLAIRSLEHRGVQHTVDVPLVDPGTATYAIGEVPFGPNGWWGITTTITRDGQDVTQARMNVLLPDPNVHGFDAPPERETSAEAQALFERGLVQMTSWTSVRTRERIASGSDAVVIIERAVMTGEENEPPAQTLVAVYSAGFAPTATGAPPPPPKFVYSYSVTIGEQGWQRAADGTWLEASPTRVSLPAEWDDTYASAEDFQLGARDEINGEPAQIITFYLPEQGAQAEAWFAWWVGIESGNVYQVAMVAQAHYMLVEYTDINEPIRIEAPTDADAEG